jgi:hypothetical protein
MNSLKEVYSAMAEQDHVKVAQQQAVEQYGTDFADVDPELVKQAQDYDTVGRIMAHNVFGDLVKEAVDEAMPFASEEDKKKETKKVVAKAKGEKSDDDDDDKDEKSDDEGSEKQAQIRDAVLARMQEDPEYVSYLLSKYEIG